MPSEIDPRDDSPQAQWERTLTPEQFAEYRKDQQVAAYGSLLFHLQETETKLAALQAVAKAAEEFLATDLDLHAEEKALAELVSALAAARAAGAMQ